MTPSKCNCNQWRVIESAPRDGTKIIGIEDGEINVCWFSGIDWVRQGDFDSFFMEPTEWFPLPPAPEDEKGKP